MRRLVAVLVLLLTPAAARAQGAPVPPGWAGTWEGEAQVANAAYAACLPWVRLTIAADGSVQGMVGDARLVRGLVKRNRGAVGRLLNVRTDWIIDAELDGPLVSSEGVRRERIRMPFDVRGDTLRGGFHATGGGERVTAGFRLRRTGG